MKKIIFILILVFLMSGCRTSKNTVENTYKKTEQANLIETVEKQEEEKAVAHTKEELEKETKENSEKTTSSIEQTTDFFEPTVENPQGGVPKSVTTKIYVTNEKAAREAIEKAIVETEEKYENLLTEKDLTIENKDKEIELLKTEVSEKDSRLIQKSEWMWIGLGLAFFFAVMSVICSISFIKT
jgi:PBP1b-binding outer membrane lipoprotein LpoB